jgi:hypothetical protein
MFESITTLIPWIQYPAAVCTIGGYYFVGSTHAKIRQYGFAVALFGNLIWIVYGALPMQIGIVVTNVCIFLLAVRGYLNNAYGIDTKLLKHMREIGLIDNNENEKL